MTDVMAVYRDYHAISILIWNSVRGKICKRMEMKWLTSFSRHLVVRLPKTAFKDNSHVGAFVVEVCCQLGINSLGIFLCILWCTICYYCFSKYQMIFLCFVLPFSMLQGDFLDYSHPTSDLFRKLEILTLICSSTCRLRDLKRLGESSTNTCEFVCA